MRGPATDSPAARPTDGPTERPGERWGRSRLSRPFENIQPHVGTNAKEGLVSASDQPAGGRHHLAAAPLA